MQKIISAAQNTRVTCIITGKLKVNTFFIQTNDSVVVIDPGGDPQTIISEIKHYPHILLLLTHCHYDHSGALNEVSAALPQARFAAHSACIRQGQNPETNLSIFLLNTTYTLKVNPDFTLEGGQNIQFQDITLQTFHSTGHSKGHLCYALPTENMIFCGDLLTAKNIGRHDVPGSDLQSMISDCQELLRLIPETMTVCPGHGSAISAQEIKNTNPYLQKYYK